MNVKSQIVDEDEANHECTHNSSLGVDVNRIVNPTSRTIFSRFPDGFLSQERVASEIIRDS